MAYTHYQFSIIEIREKYQLLRNEAYSKAMNFFSQKFGEDLLLLPWNQQTIQKTLEWPPKLNWTKVTESSNNLRPSRFELSIWLKDELCGLAFGRTSRGTSHVRIDMIERAPNAKALKGWVTPISLYTAIEYASLIGRKKVLITSPNKKLYKHYSNITDGYKKIGKKHFDYFYVNISSPNAV